MTLEGGICIDLEVLAFEQLNIFPVVPLGNQCLRTAKEAIAPSWGSRIPSDVCLEGA